MALDRANLPTDIAELHRIILAQAAEGEAREAELAAAKAGLLAKALEVEKLRLQIARLKRMQFGRSSEKIARTIEQLELRLEELEAEAPAPAAADASETSSEQSSPVEPCSPPDRKKSERRALPAHLPSREVVHEPSCTCPTCGGEMRKVGEDVTQILDYIPGHFEVVRHIRPAFSCRRCETLAHTAMPSLPIERGRPGRACWRTSWSANTATIFRSIGNPASTHAKASSSIGPPWQRVFHSQRSGPDRMHYS